MIAGLCDKASRYLGLTMAAAAAAATAAPAVPVVPVVPTVVASHAHTSNRPGFPVVWCPTVRRGVQSANQDTVQSAGTARYHQPVDASTHSSVTG